MVTTMAAKITWKTFFKVLSQARAFSSLARTLTTGVYFRVPDDLCCAVVLET